MTAKQTVLCACMALCVLCVHGQEVGDTLTEVVVTATGTHYRLKDVPVQTEVISRRDLEAYGGRSLEDLE